MECQGQNQAADSFDFYLQIGAVVAYVRSTERGIAPHNGRNSLGSPGVGARAAPDSESSDACCCGKLPTQTNHSRCADGIEVRTFLGTVRFVSRVLTRSGSDCGCDGSCKRNDPGGVSRFRLPCGRYAEAPAADLVTARVVSRTPEISPEWRRYADFSGALHCLAGRGGAA